MCPLNSIVDGKPNNADCDSKDCPYRTEDIDIVTILEDLKKEMSSIKECEYQIYGKEHWNFVGKCQDIVQQKINKLKG